MFVMVVLYNNDSTKIELRVNLVNTVD